MKRETMIDSPQLAGGIKEKMSAFPVGIIDYEIEQYKALKLRNEAIA